MCKPPYSFASAAAGLMMGQQNSAAAQQWNESMARNGLAHLPVSAPEPTLVERGYLDNLPPPVDPAVKLAEILARAAIVSIDKDAHLSPALLRNFIRNHWSKVSALAHQIHEEDSK